jgi:putative addiction module killer protein
MRLDRIAIDGHFGVTNFFDGIIELKWKSGLRIYTARLGQVVIVVLAGGTKHGQSKDINKAKKLLEEIKGSGFTSS